MNQSRADPKITFNTKVAGAINVFILVMTIIIISVIAGEHGKRKGKSHTPPHDEQSPQDKSHFEANQEQIKKVQAMKCEEKYPQPQRPDNYDSLPPDQKQAFDMKASVASNELQSCYQPYIDQLNEQDEKRATKKSILYFIGFFIIFGVIPFAIALYRWYYGFKKGNNLYYKNDLFAATIYFTLLFTLTTIFMIIVVSAIHKHANKPKQ